MIAAPGAFLEVVLHAVAGLVVGYSLVRLYQWTRGQSCLLGIIVAAGLLLQAVSGLLMFWVSYLDLPVLSGLHSGDGFWEIAPDAAFYTMRAAEAVNAGLTTINSTEASPAYLRLLTIWMNLVGISPASGMFLNMAVYGLFCALVVWVWKPSANWRQDLPSAVLLASISFSPLLVFSGTQTLKDNTYVFLLAGACVGVWLILGAVSHGLRKGTSFSDVLIGLGLLLLTLYAMAGIRAYYAFMVWGSLSLMLALLALPWTTERLLRRLPLALLIAVLTFVSSVVGAGPYVDALRSGIVAQSDDSEGLDGWVTGAFKLIDRYRLGFETTPAATNIAARRPSEPRDEDLPQAPVSTTVTAPEAASRSGISVYVPRLMVGLATFFVPMSLLQTFSLVQFPGGRGLLFLTDVDTLFIDATLIASLILLSLRWKTVRLHLPYVCCLLLLACVSIALLSYVVVNFGTLVRLRPMAVVPIWMAVLAVSPERSSKAFPREGFKPLHKDDETGASPS